MKQIIPLTKELKFNNKIAEILSISLEHELKNKEDEIQGNFIVSGEYKSHEISVNKEKFNFKVPFSVMLTENIDPASFNFTINDFYYDVINEDILKINIEYIIEADEIEADVINEDIFKVIDEERETFPEIVPYVDPEETVKDKVDLINDDMGIISEVTNSEDQFKTYHIHIVRENETIQTICEKYHTDVEFIKKFNNINDVINGDKLIIPHTNDE